MKALGYVKGTFSLIGDFFRLGMIFIKRPHYLLVLAGIVVGIFYLCGIPPKQLPEWWKKTFVPAVSSRVDEFAMRTKKAASPLTDAVSDFVSVPKKEPEQTKEAEKVKEPEPLFVTSPKAPVKWGRQTGKENETQGTAAPVAPSAPKEEYKFKQKERAHPVENTAAPKRRVPAPEWSRVDENVQAAPVVMVPTHAENRAEVLDKMLDNVVRETAVAQNNAPQYRRPQKAREDGTCVEGIASVVGGDALKINGKVIRLKGIRIKSGKNVEAYRTLSRRVSNMHVSCFIKKGEDKAECYEGKESLSQYLIDMRLAD